MPEAVHLLHVSDLHYSSAHGLDQRIVWDAFMEDLGADGIDQPFLVAFTGDLVRDADEPDAYLKVADLFSGAIGKIGVPEQNLLTTPGNHDAARTVVGTHLPYLDETRTACRTREGANKTFSDPKLLRYVSEVFRNYREMCDLFPRTARTSSSSLAETYFYRDSGVGVVTVNTSALSGAGLNGSDERHLAVSEHVVLTALELLPQSSLKIVLGHHPLNWLNHESEAAMEWLLSHHNAIYLHGHMHDARPKDVRTLDGRCFFAQSGALFTDRRYYNGYALLSCSATDRHIRSLYRSYYEKRREFDEATDLIKRGVYFSSPAAKRYWEKAAPTLNAGALEKWRVEVLLPFLSKECSATLSEHSLDTVFVLPEFEKSTPVDKETETRLGAKVEVVALNEVIAGSDNLLIAAGGESGKTSFLRHWALELARSSATDIRWSLPVLLPFNEVPPYSGKFESAVRAKLPELPRGMKIADVLSEGRVTFLIDDVDFAKVEQRARLADFISAYPRARYVATSSTPLLDGTALHPVVSHSVPFSVLRMRDFRTRQLRALIDNHGLKDPGVAEQLIHRMFRESEQLGMPLTPVTGTFLIQIFQEDGDTVIFNRASLIERFVEILLHKFAIRDLLPGAFDFANRIDVLAHIAERMTRSDNNDPSEASVLEWISEYLVSFGFPYTARKILDYFISARILERERDNVQFKLRAFLEYFIAIRMSKSVLFKGFVLSTERYLGFINEIAFYSAIVRDDELTLELLHGRFREALKTMWLDVPKELSGMESLEDVPIPDPDATLEQLQEVEVKLLRQRLTQEERDLVLDEDLNRLTFDQKVKRTYFREEGVHPLAQMLLLSAVVKHMELVPDPKKRTLIHELLEEWIRFCMLSIVIVPSIAEHRRLFFNGVEYVVNLPEHLSVGELAQRLTMGMPIGVARLAGQAMGTEKLRLQLEDGIGTKQVSRPQQFFRFAILSDLAVSDLGLLAASTANGLAGSKFLLNVFVRKLRELNTRYKIPTADLDKIRVVAADIIVLLSGDKGRAAGERKGKLINDLREWDLTMKLARKD